MNNVPEKFSHKISLEDHKKAQHYSIAKGKLSLFSNIFGSIIFLSWIFAGGIQLLYSFLLQFSFSSMTMGIVYILFFNIINGLLSIPESLYSTFIIEEKFGFNKMSLKMFFVDSTKQLILSLIIGVPLLYVILYFVNYAGENWWLITWSFLILFQFVMVWAYPKFIAPFFNKFSILEDPKLSDEIKELTERCEIDFKDYYVMNASIRSSHGNAYFTGFGKNKRIVFFDTLLSSLAPKEVIAVLAHELGHLKKKHILKSIVLGTTLMLIGLFILGKLYNSPEFFNAFNSPTKEPFMALLLFILITPSYTYILTPLFSLSSRKNEFEADEYAAKKSNAKDLISALLKMYKDNSSTLTPHPLYSKFYFSHPPANERVKFLEKFISNS